LNDSNRRLLLGIWNVMNGEQLEIPDV